MDPLYELLAPYFDNADTSSHPNRPPPTLTPQITTYFTRLSALSLSELASTEPSALAQSLQSHVRNLQSLSKRSHAAVISSDTHLSNLTTLLPSLETQSSDLHTHLPELENAASAFASKYDRSSAENAVLDRRKTALLLARNVDRVTDVLDLPTLLSSTVSSAQSTTSTTSSTSSSSAATSYASALDLNAHIKRLNALYPSSDLVRSISQQAEAEIENLIAILITSLQSPSLKLAGAMRAIGWLRRVAPDLAEDGYGYGYGGSGMRAQPTSMKGLSISPNPASTDGSLGALFLICRLHTLRDTLDALEPLRELAEQETTAGKKQGNSSTAKSGANKTGKQQTAVTPAGTQSERYLKRYIEIFREQSFSIVSMYKSIFPSGLPTPDGGSKDANRSASSNDDESESGLSLPSPLASFALQLVQMLSTTLQTYIPAITDKQARESLLTQVLYCAGSLGRLGADFGMVLAVLQDDLVTITPSADGAVGERESEEHEEGDPEWVVVMKKHRIQASRLEVLARGVGAGKKKGSTDGLTSPGSVVSPG